VYADEQHVRVILQNLLSNALKYSPAGSAVELQLAPSSRAGTPGVVVSISNQAGAAGVPDADKVFSRYYRSAGARSQAGAGLGLWLCHTLASQLGSELHFHNDQSTIRFSFFLEAA
jgi:signal transduction histidine kinase